MNGTKKKIGYLVVDTTAFIQNAQLQDVAENIVTCQEVVDEITNKRQLKRLVVLPYDLQIKNVYPESIKVVTEFSKKTGDYPSLSATDIKVLALTYQLEKEHVGVDHLRTEPLYQRTVNVTGQNKDDQIESNLNIVGFVAPTDEPDDEDDTVDDLQEEFETLKVDEILPKCEESENSDCSETDEDDDGGWITPSNVNIAKKQINSTEIEEKEVQVACMTTDFAMQNVLKQFNLNVSALDGRMIKQLRTFILRCYTCFKTTSIMTKMFCPKCGNNTLKKVAVSVDENGKMQIHINSRRPLTGRGKKFSLPRIKGGKHPNNPRLVEDQPMAHDKPSRIATTKNNPLDDDYIAGYSPFVLRDVNSRSAHLNIKPGNEVKYWMRKNPNEARRKRK